MLALTLSPLGNILKTEASQNNETGVPKTLLQLNPEHKAAIIEMGMRGRGQIEYLCQIAAPTAGVVTLIAENHIELLGSIEEIAESKGELLEFLSLDGVAFINADDIYCAKLASKHRGRVVTFAVDSPAEYKADNLVFRNNSWTFEINGQMLTIATPSRHDVSNAVTAYAVAYTFGVDPESAASALARYEPPPMRMQIIDGASWGGTILNDAYNAAPASMRAALETLSRYGGGRKIAFLGDMRELGDYAAPAHEELGAVIQDLGGLDALYTVGDLAAHIFGASRRFKTSEDAALFARDELMLDKGDIILVKGSRVMEMERIASALRNKERHDEF
jgi:UDP-N-acetylmuramoyl-tripeptide--D-alanyl-D-alanine ligase